MGEELLEPREVDRLRRRRSRHDNLQQGFRGEAGQSQVAAQVEHPQVDRRVRPVHVLRVHRDYHGQPLQSIN